MNWRKRYELDKLSNAEVGDLIGFTWPDGDRMYGVLTKIRKGTDRKTEYWANYRDNIDSAKVHMGEDGLMFEHNFEDTKDFKIEIKGFLG